MVVEYDYVSAYPEELVTNHIRAQAVQALEQGLRAIERYKLTTCIEHGGTWCRGKGLYHANGKVRHHCVKDAAPRG